MHPAEGQRRGEDGHVARLQAVDGLLVGVEADELAVLGNVNLLGEFPREVLEAGLQPVLEHVRHRHELNVFTGVHGVGGRAGACDSLLRCADHLLDLRICAGSVAAPDGSIQQIVCSQTAARSGNGRRVRL